MQYVDWFKDILLDKYVNPYWVNVSIRLENKEIGRFHLLDFTSSSIKSMWYYLHRQQQQRITTIENLWQATNKCFYLIV